MFHFEPGPLTATDPLEPGAKLGSKNITDITRQARLRAATFLILPARKFRIGQRF